MSINDPAAFARQLNKASLSAYLAVPTAYGLVDQLVFSADQFSSSANLSPDETFTEVDILRLTSNLEGGALGTLEQQIYGLLSSTIMQNAFGGTKADPITAQAQQQNQQDLIEKLIKSFTARKEHRMELYARMKAENKHVTEQTDQLNRMFGSDIAGANGFSEEKINAMQELTHAFVQHPDDLEINA